MKTDERWETMYEGHWVPLPTGDGFGELPDQDMPVLVSDGSTWRLLSWIPDHETGEPLWFNSDEVEIELGDFTPLFWTEGPTLPRLVDLNARKLASGDYTLCPVCGEEPILWEELMRFGGCDKCTGDAEC